jgi:hypothetical protein
MSTPDRKPTVPITARNRADYEAKVAATLKTEYKQGDTVDLVRFHDEHQVRPAVVRDVIAKIETEYPLKLPPVEKPVVKGR